MLDLSQQSARPRRKAERVKQFPRTTVGGVSVSRLVIGTNWFRGYSHTSKAKDQFIKSYQTCKNIADIIEVFVQHGIDTILGVSDDVSSEAVNEAEQRTGHQIVRMITPHFNIRPGGPPELDPEVVFDRCRELGATFCMPHQCMTDVLIDRLERKIRHMDRYSGMIRERNMIPGLSTHMPETVGIADESGVDVETYIQLYNAAGFLMQAEADWVMRVIQKAKKPVVTIKPLAAGRLLPPVGLAFSWNTIRDCDMVAVGTMTPDEAREIIDLSFSFLEKRIPEIELQTTRSKRTLEAGGKRGAAGE